MKITSSWLKDHLKTNANIEKIVSTLNNIGLEVESVGSADKNNFFFVAKIIKAEKHPNADKLKLCDVDIGSGKIVKVVCGASNARDGLLTVYAGPGAIIPKNQLKIKVTNIRGIDSYGMLCSESELGLSDESQGITELDSKKFKVGSSYFKNNSEPAIDISITPNRSDCQGVRGIARDLSTAGLGKLIDLEQIKLKTNIKNPFKVILQSNSGCSSFAHCYIEGIKNSESPKWLKDKLIAVGMNPISAVVDITNYIMLDLNRPLHAYDADKIEKKVIVRASRKGEKFSALDNNTYSLEDGACLITNEKEILGLGGVIGGKNSSISLDTKNIFLESALFDPVKISKIAKKLGINSDAKFRFERGVDPNGMEYGLKLAAKIIHKICGGKISNLIISGENNFKNKQIKFNSDKFEKIIGSKISPAEIKKILNNLPESIQKQYSQLWNEYQSNDSKEAKIVHQLDPAGVGARDLQECLLIQLQRKTQNINVELAMHIIDKAFEQFSKKHYKKLLQKFDITEIQDDILRVIDYLKSIGCLSHHFGITTDPATSIETNLPIKPTRLNNGRIVFVDNQDNIYYNVKVVKVWFSKDNFVRHQLYLINRTPKINESKVFKNIIAKDEFPSEDQIKDYFYDLTDNVSDLSELLVRSGYVFFPTSDIDQSVKSEMMTDMDSDNWLDKEASSLAKTKWVDFFRPVTNLKHWDMSEFLPNDDVLNWYGEKRVEDYIFSEKLYNKIIKGDIFILHPFEIADPIFLEDCTVLIIKTPSKPGDKFTI